MGVDISSLSLAEQKDLYAKLSYQFKDEVGASDAVRSLLNELNDAAGLPSGGRRPLKQFLEQAGNKSRLSRASEIIDGLMARAVPSKTVHVVEMRVRAMMLLSLASYIRMGGAPVTVTNLLVNFDKLRDAVEADYPGYIQAQMLHRIAGVSRAA